MWPLPASDDLASAPLLPWLPAWSPILWVQPTRNVSTCAIPKCALRSSDVCQKRHPKSFRTWSRGIHVQVELTLSTICQRFERQQLMIKFIVQLNFNFNHHWTLLPPKSHLHFLFKLLSVVYLVWNICSTLKGGAREGKSLTKRRSLDNMAALDLFYPPTLHATQLHSSPLIVSNIKATSSLELNSW